MCPPVNGACEEPCPGRHAGRPLPILLQHPSTPEKRTGTKPRPCGSDAAQAADRLSILNSQLSILDSHRISRGKAHCAFPPFVLC